MKETNNQLENINTPVKVTDRSKVDNIEDAIAHLRGYAKILESKNIPNLAVIKLIKELEEGE